MSDLNEVLYEFLFNTMNLNEAISSIIVILISVVIWIIIGVIFNKVLAVFIKRGFKTKKGDARALTISKLVISIVRYVVWFIIILLILGQLGVDITPFIASAGVIGLAVGFGAQALVTDFISGFFIILEHTLDVNDVVQIDGFKGNVVSLGLRSTVIQNWKGEVKTISNGNIGSIINFSRNDSIGIVEFGVSYDTDLSAFADLMKEFTAEASKKFTTFTEAPQFLGVTELADSSINMSIIFKTKPMQYFGLERDLRKELVEFCNKHNVEIPFPQLVVHNGKS